jgi:hypothetical protein
VDVVETGAGASERLLEQLGREAVVARSGGDLVRLASAAR